jgi:hypothetical protein
MIGRRTITVYYIFNPNTKNFLIILIFCTILTSADKHQGHTLVQELHMLCVLASLHASPFESTGCFKKSFINVTVWRVLRKLSHLEAYKLSAVQHLMDVDKVVRMEFCMQMFHTPDMLHSVWQEINYHSASLPLEVALNHNYLR